MIKHRSPQIHVLGQSAVVEPLFSKGHSHGDNVFNTLKLALLNIRSSINDFIIKHNLDLMFLTETWLDQNNSAAVLIESTPPNFNFMREAGVHKKGGGVAILYNDSLQCKQISYGTFASLEYVVLRFPIKKGGR